MLPNIVVDLAHRAVTCILVSDLNGWVIWLLVVTPQVMWLHMDRDGPMALACHIEFEFTVYVVADKLREARGFTVCLIVILHKFEGRCSDPSRCSFSLLV